MKNYRVVTIVLVIVVCFVVSYLYLMSGGGGPQNRQGQPTRYVGWLEHGHALRSAAIGMDQLPSVDPDTGMIHIVDAGTGRDIWITPGTPFRVDRHEQ